MAVNLTQVIELAAFAATVTGFLLATGITYFEDRIPDRIKEVDAWLKEVQEELGKEITRWCKSDKEEREYEQILSVASEFSAVKGMGEELDAMEVRNSGQVKMNLLTLLMIGGSVIVFYYAGAQDSQSLLYSESIGLATLIALIAVTLWLVGLASFYSLYSDYSRLKRLVRLKVLEPIEST